MYKKLMTVKIVVEVVMQAWGGPCSIRCIWLRKPPFIDLYIYIDREREREREREENPGEFGNKMQKLLTIGLRLARDGVALLRESPV